MEIIKYQKKNHSQIIQACVQALKQGKVVVYPTDTSYGLAADIGNVKALNRLYKIKERTVRQPVHVVVPSLAYAKKVVSWSKAAELLGKVFLPGPLTLVLPLKVKKANLVGLSAKTGYLGVRMPKHAVALDLARVLGRPITATGANPSAHLSGGFDSYSAGEVVKQFKNKKHTPDIIIDAGRLPKRKPSTLVKVTLKNELETLRQGPITEKQIKIALSTKH